ncbi:MAG TPA: 4-(cytidine 5'-diphospho)-2-C-methyl-D-erythritol kinase [Alphaproteobacteria bacterium]
MARETVHRPAPAKLNLYLHVVGRRADGYHLLDSLVAFAGVHDTVSAGKAEALTLSLEGPFAAALSGEADNLVLRAARALADAAGVRPHAALRLIKRLPVASGIGGGSADAAATLAAAGALWRVTPKPGALAALGLKLGADVPACLAGKAAQVGGIGEKIAPAPALPRVPLVLVNPLVPLPTPSVFKARSGPFSKPAPLPAAPRDARDLAEALAARRNDLADAAIGLVPEIKVMLAALEAQPGCLLARMSGSGATCFALFAREAEAAAATAALRANNPAWWVKASELLSDTAMLVPALD